MKNIPKNKNGYCPVDYAFLRIGGKYKGRILWFLKDGVLRYGELKKVVEGISTKMLTQTLRELEEDSLVARKSFPQVPPKVEYTLTSSGRELIPSIDLLRIWGTAQIEKQ